MLSWSLQHYPSFIRSLMSDFSPKQNTICYFFLNVNLYYREVVKFTLRNEMRNFQNGKRWGFACMAQIQWVPHSVFLSFNFRTLSFAQVMHIPGVISTPRELGSHNLVWYTVRWNGNTRMCWLPEVPPFSSFKKESWDDCSHSERTASCYWALSLSYWKTLRVYLAYVYLQSYSLDDAIFD